MTRQTLSRHAWVTRQTLSRHAWVTQPRLSVDMHEWHNPDSQYRHAWVTRQTLSRHAWVTPRGTASCIYLAYSSIVSFWPANPNGMFLVLGYIVIMTTTLFIQTLQLYTVVAKYVSYYIIHCVCWFCHDFPPGETRWSENPNYLVRMSCYYCPSPWREIHAWLSLSKMWTSGLWW